MKLTPLIFIASTVCFCSAGLASASNENQGVVSRILKKPKNKTSKGKKPKSGKGVKKSRSSKSAKFQGIKAKKFDIDLFKSIDTNDDGIIDIGEFVVPWSLYGKKTSESFANDDFEAATGMDADPDGELDFEAFLGTDYFIHVKSFNDLDVDGDGFITADDLVASSKTPEEAATEIFEGDIDGDDKLSLKEYIWTFTENNKKKFLSIDTNQSGLIGPMELYAFFQAQGPYTPEEIEAAVVEFLGGTDLTGEGINDPFEYLSGQGYFTKEEAFVVLTILFNEIDLDGDGFLSTAEVGFAFGDELVEFVLNYFDGDGDGMFDLEELEFFYETFYAL